MLARRHYDYITYKEEKKDFRTIETEQRSYKLKKQVKRRLIVFAVLVTVTFVYMGSFLHGQSVDLETKKKELQILKKELHTVKETEKELEQEVIRLQNPEYIGKLARRDYFLSKEGEIIFQIPE